MKRSFAAIFTLLLALTLPPALSAQPQSDEAQLRAWIRTMSSDEFGGRRPMSPFEDVTVRYLSGELQKLGLQPAFGDSWYQPFRMITVATRVHGDKVRVKGRRKAELLVPEDLSVWSARATDEVKLKDVEFVFCGFGINAPEYGWNDYEGVDVRGKIVVAMVNDPGFYDPALFRGRNMTYYGRWVYKLEEARRQGAAGCLILHDTDAAGYAWSVCMSGHMKADMALYNPETGNADELGVKGWISADGGRKLFAAGGLDFDAAFEAAKRPGSRAIPLRVRGDIHLELDYKVEQTRNVAGILPGTDLSEEAVVLCAHWDHLGSGLPDESGDEIYNGAADNASGMASVLLAAKKIRELPLAPRRSIVFFFPSSEESGLFGSQYYCEHPPVPMSRTAACMNFESVGPAELTEDVVILGGGESVLDRYFVAAAAAQGRYIFFDDDNSDGWFYRSDHYNFFRRGVPALVVENGLHPVHPDRPNRYPMASWYHKPSDEYRDDWDLEGTLANVNLMLSVALSVANK